MGLPNKVMFCRAYGGRVCSANGAFLAAKMVNFHVCNDTYHAKAMINSYVRFPKFTKEDCQKRFFGVCKTGERSEIPDKETGKVTRKIQTVDGTQPVGITKKPMPDNASALGFSLLCSWHISALKEELACSIRKVIFSNSLPSPSLALLSIVPLFPFS
nr:hypothetical protein Iba_chr13bCG1050 [Ipomoea batatas]